MKGTIKVTVTASKRLCEIESSYQGDIQLSHSGVVFGSHVKKFRLNGGVLSVPANTDGLEYVDTIIVFTDDDAMTRAVSAIRDLAKIAKAEYVELWK